YTTLFRSSGEILRFGSRPGGRGRPPQRDLIRPARAESPSDAILPSLPFFPSIQSCNSKGIGRPGDILKSGLSHALEQFVRLGKTLDRGRQVRVRSLHAGDDCTHPGKHVLEVHAVQLADESSGLAKIENSALSTWTQHTRDLPQAGLV